MDSCIKNGIRKDIYWRSKGLTAQYDMMRTTAKEVWRFEAAVGAILTADFICREYNIKYEIEQYIRIDTHI